MSCAMGKRALRSLSLSYLKKDWRAGPLQSFFRYDNKRNWWDSYSKVALWTLWYEKCPRSFYSWCYTKRRSGGPPTANPSVGMTTIKILRHAFPWHGSPCSWGGWVDGALATLSQRWRQITQGFWTDKDPCGESFKKCHEKYSIYILCTKSEHSL